MTATDQHHPLTRELILSFCSKDLWRHKLAAPFTYGAYSYATDGMVALRFPSREDIAADNAATAASLAVFLDGDGWEEIYPSAGWEEMKGFTIPCKQCDGKGNFRKCPECEGDGEIECFHCGHEEDCKKCDGTGRIPCEDGETCTACHGTGQLEEPVYVSGFPNGMKTTVAMLRKIHTLPSPRFYQRPQTSPIRFTFDGGEGCFQPVSKP
jgi:hypothetical protein